MQESTFNHHAETGPAAEDSNAIQILDENRIADHDGDGNPIPVTIPIELAPGVRVTYTTRLGGVSTDHFAQLNLGGKGGDKPEHVLANRRALADALQAPLALVSQVHSGHALDIDEVWQHNAAFGFDASGTISQSSPDTRASDDRLDASIRGVAGSIIEADGQVSQQSHIALGMFAADCLPVLMADPKHHIIAAAHCGRKGLQRGIIASTIAVMKEHGAEEHAIVATLGPCICGDCYEVGDHIADEFNEQFPGTATHTRFGGKGIDIAKAATLALQQCGVKHLISSIPRVRAATQYLAHDEVLDRLCAQDGEGPDSLAERVEQIRHGLCTLENPLWFSHRRSALAGNEHEGRMLALITQDDSLTPAPLTRDVD